MTTKRIFAAVLLVAAGIISINGTSYSQTAERDKIIGALDMTDSVIREARRVVTESRSQKARHALENAITLQERARVRAESEHYMSTNQNDFAYKLTMQARKEAKRAVSFARTETRMVEKHRRVMERTRERLMALQSRMSDSGTKDGRTEKFLDDARGLLDKSRTNSTQMNNRLALNLALNAEKLTGQAENRFRNTNNLRKMCQRRLNMMERLTIRARNRVADSDDPGELEQLRMAERQMEQARNFFSEGRYNACRTEIVKSEKSMRALLNRIGPGTESQSQLRIRQTWRLYETAEEKVNETGDGGELLKQAERIINSAEEETRNGNSEKTGQLLNRARLILRRIVNESRQPMSKERIHERLRNLEMEKRNIRTVVENCEAPESKTLYQRALNHLEKARDDMDADRLEAAYAATTVAKNIFDRITEICSI